MELRESRICGTGELLSAKFPVERRTFAPHCCIRPGRADCSYQKRRPAGTSNSWKSIVAKSRNSSRRLGPKATVTRRSGTTARCGNTLRM